MSIFEGMEDALSREAGFAFNRFIDAYREDQGLAKENLKKRLQHLIETHDIAVDVLEEVMQGDEKEDIP
jgi:hypothetical protein